jgi:hypothetical protein
VIFDSKADFGEAFTKLGGIVSSTSRINLIIPQNHLVALIDVVRHIGMVPDGGGIDARITHLAQIGPNQIPSQFERV